MTYSFLIVHPFDPWGGKIGGIETAIRASIRYAPDDFKISLIGVTEDAERRPVGRWIEDTREGKPISFYPIMRVKNANRRTFIPLFLRFSLMLSRYPFLFPSSIAVYHRVEPLFCSRIKAAVNILFIHGDPREITGPHSEVRWKHIPRFYHKVEQTAVRKAEQILVISRKGTDYLRNFYNREDTIRFFPMGYREELFSLPDQQELEQIRQRVYQHFHLDPSRRYALFAGRFEKQKDPLFALDAFAIVASQIDDIDILFAGDGSMKPFMARKVKTLGLENRVHFLGTLDSSNLSSVMLASEVFLISSRFEGMPIVVLEAMACGLPIVSTNVGEIQDMIHDGMTGKIVSEHTKEALAAALIEVLENPEKWKKETCAQQALPFRMSVVMDQFYRMIRGWGKVNEHSSTI